MLGLNLGAGLHSFGALAAAFFGDKEINEEAAALSSRTGWLFLAAAAAVVGYFIIHSDRWRRFWLEREDPRSIGLYRIVFGFFVLANMNDFYEYFTFLFTDEGIFTADIARHVHARGQFRGFGDGFTEEEPWGFFDATAVWEFLKGQKYSLLYFWDTPGFFRAHIAAFYFTSVMFIIGWRTRLFGILTYFLMNSIFFRNHLFWEGTELVYRVFLVYLLCAKSGHAYSVDNWLRCRRLRKQGRLSEPGGPGGGAGLPPDTDEDHPKGLRAIYRLIPAWPRRLMMIQFGFLYATTGILKNGNVWARGDAIYYAWNMDHFYRFHPQQITAALGTTVLRFATWTTHWGESFFAVVLLSVFYWWRKSQGFPPLPASRRFLARLCLATVLGVAAALIWVTWPVHYSPNFFPKGQDPDGTTSRLIFVSLFVGVLVGLYLLWLRMGKKPLFTVRKLPKIGELSTPAKIDQDWVMKWIFGRRLWLPWHVSVMGGIFVLMNIGQFQTAMLSNTILFFSGVEVAKFGRFLARNAHRAIPKSTVAKVALFWWLWLPKLIIAVASDSAKKGDPIVPPEDPHLSQVAREVGPPPRFGVLRWLIAAGQVVLGAYLLWANSITLGTIFVILGLGTFVFAALLSDLRVPKVDKLVLEPYQKRDAVHFPRWAMVATALFVLIGVLVKVRGVSESNHLKALQKEQGLHKEEALQQVSQSVIWMGEHWSWIWIGAALFAAGVVFQRWRVSGKQTIPAEDPESGVVRAPWAYGPFGRFLASGVIIWQITAVTTWLLPDKDSLRTWRPEARKVFQKWLTLTSTDQGWGMFAPNPPRSNVFLKVIVTDSHGEEWDMKSDVYAPERKPIPWIWNDRMRKMNRRIIGGESGNTEWYRKWFARWHCRQWALEHDGETPQKVELIKVWYKIPPPEQTFPNKWYDPMDLLERTGHEEVKYTERCRGAVMGQLPNWIRERHGLPPLPDNLEYKPWIKHKRRNWEKHLAKQRGEEPPKANNKDAKKKQARKKRTTARREQTIDSGSLEKLRARREELEAQAKEDKGN